MIYCHKMKLAQIKNSLLVFLLICIPYSLYSTAQSQLQEGGIKSNWLSKEKLSANGLKNNTEREKLFAVLKTFMDTVSKGGDHKDVVKDFYSSKDSKVWNIKIEEVLKLVNNANKKEFKTTN